jgi:hypothetical protein
MNRLTRIADRAIDRIDDLAPWNIQIGTINA